MLTMDSIADLSDAIAHQRNPNYVPSIALHRVASKTLGETMQDTGIDIRPMILTQRLVISSQQCRRDLLTKAHIRSKVRREKGRLKMVHRPPYSSLLGYAGIWKVQQELSSRGAESRETDGRERID